MSTPKYRPSFTEQEIQYILHLCSQDTAAETAAMAHAVSSKLRLFCAKMQLGIVSPAYTATAPHKQNLTELLGESTESPAERRKLAYNKWCISPSLCTPAEVAMAQTYRYENNLMTPDEELQYEQDQG